ncbi:hypothetical protein [Acidiferrobacter sp.]|uniref:hypothetical protein n=1 Tax=Acidiferrobacter sp. TaxID=1872107 RepID=UPI00262E0A28|nr:hypothetical protein [Acidiferrobacter sp.]
MRRRFWHPIRRVRGFVRGHHSPRRWQLTGFGADRGWFFLRTPRPPSVILGMVSYPNETTNPHHGLM